ncbi:MAG: hypothetical protein PHX87_05835 [Candidatus Peribacteraceae bacterium]|nr:hypothetical protein [Candidatus Peribacteraceae bacterium]MDD5742912.1 hypothetical protein [Candidatus Peribacteraceae bacterium]
MMTSEIPTQENTGGPVKLVSMSEFLEDTPNQGPWIINRIETLMSVGVEKEDATYIASKEAIPRMGGSLFPSEQSHLDALREKYHLILEQTDAPRAQRAVSQYLRLDRLVGHGTASDAAWFIADAETVLKQSGILSAAQRAKLDEYYAQYREQSDEADISHDEILHQLLTHITDTSQRFWKEVDSGRWFGCNYRDAFIVEFLLAIEKHVRPLSVAERTTLEMRRVHARATYFSSYLQGHNSNLDAENILFMELQQSKGVTLTAEQEFLLRSYRVKYQSLIKNGGLKIGESAQ